MPTNRTFCWYQYIGMYRTFGCRNNIFLCSSERISYRMAIRVFRWPCVWACPIPVCAATAPSFLSICVVSPLFPSCLEMVSRWREMYFLVKKILADCSYKLNYRASESLLHKHFLPNRSCCWTCSRVERSVLFWNEVSSNNSCNGCFCFSSIQSRYSDVSNF